MTDPIGTAQELIERLRSPEAIRADAWSVCQQAADALQSRIAEVGRLTDTVEQEISAWAFAHDIDGAARNELFVRIRAALSLHRRPT